MTRKEAERILDSEPHDDHAHGGHSARRTGLMPNCKRCDALRAIPVEDRSNEEQRGPYNPHNLED